MVRKPSCPLCLTLGYVRVAGMVIPCERCCTGAAGLRPYHASRRVRGALRGVRALDELRQLLFEFAQEPPATASAYECGRSDGEVEATKAIWLELDRILSEGEHRAVVRIAA